jgi:hypothetical protein
MKPLTDIASGLMTSYTSDYVVQEPIWSYYRAVRQPDWV